MFILQGLNLKNSFKTVTGFLLLLNFLIFIYATIQSKSVILPTGHDLWLLGAKDSLSILDGEWFRIITACFLHVGIIHYLLNAAALNLIGHDIEYFYGKVFVLLVYIFAGIYGNIFSLFLNVHISAGASGSIFGLIGAGFFFEQWNHIHKKGNRFLLYLKKPVLGPYSYMIIINYILALILNYLAFFFNIQIGIDNAAHTGGLLCGLLFSAFYSFLVQLSNSIQKSMYLSFFLVFVFGCAFIPLKYAFDSRYLSNLYFEEALSASDHVDNAPFLNIAYVLNPDNRVIGLEYAKVLVKKSNYKEAIKVFYHLLRSGFSPQELKDFFKNSDDKFSLEQQRFVIKFTQSIEN